MKTKEFKIKGHGKDQSQGNGKIENQYQSQKRQHKTLLLPLKLTRQNKTKQDKTRRDKTRQDKTRQDKTRQDKTRQKTKNTREDKKTRLICTSESLPR